MIIILKVLLKNLHFYKLIIIIDKTSYNYYITMSYKSLLTHKCYCYTNQIRSFSLL